MFSNGLHNRLYQNARHNLIGIARGLYTGVSTVAKFGNAPNLEVRATITEAAVTGASISAGFDLILFDN